MPVRIKRTFLLLFLFLSAAALMVQCTSTSAPVQHPNGLTCQSYTSSSSAGLDITKGSDCRFKCPDGRLLSLPEAVVSQSKDQLNFLFCGVPLPTATSMPGANGANLTATPPLVSPLSHVVAGCDLQLHILNFSFLQSPPNLQGQTLTVDVQGQPTQCTSSPGMPGILSCKIPPHISFPAGIVIKMNGQTVDLFPFTGQGCTFGQPTRIPHTATPESTSVAPTQPAPTRAATQPPPTQPPATQPPATQPAPTQPAPTQPPATQPPATQPPATQPPATQAPATQPTSAPSLGFPLLPGLFGFLMPW